MELQQKRALATDNQLTLDVLQMYVKSTIDNKMFQVGTEEGASVLAVLTMTRHQNQLAGIQKSPQRHYVQDQDKAET